MKRRKSNEPRSCAKSLPRAVYAENKNSTKESAKRKYNHNYYGFVSLPFCRLFLRAWGSRQLCFRFKDSGMEEEMETNNIGERLRLLRTRNNLSQEEFCPEELCDPDFCPVFSNETEPVSEDPPRPLMHFTASLVNCRLTNFVHT